MPKNIEVMRMPNYGIHSLYHLGTNLNRFSASHTSIIHAPNAILIFQSLDYLIFNSKSEKILDSSQWLQGTNLQMVY